MMLSELSWPRHTRRLALRPLTADDLDRVYAYRSQPAAYQWTLRAVTSPTDFGERLMRAWADPAVLGLVVELDASIVGDAFLKIGDAWAQDDLAAATRSQGEIGYVIDPAHAGRGVASEVARELVRIGLVDLGLRRLTADCFADNHASRRVLEKAGFRLEALHRKESLHRSRGWVDSCSYAVLAEERADWAGE